MAGAKSFCPLCGAPLDSPARKRLVRCTECKQRVRPRTSQPKKKRTELTGTPRHLAKGELARGKAADQSIPPEDGPRSAQLPPFSSTVDRAIVAASESKPRRELRPLLDSLSGAGSLPPPGKEGSGRFTLTNRPSIVQRLSRMSMDVAGRTSMVEIAQVAERVVARTTRSRIPPRFGIRAVVAIGSVAIVMLLLTAALTIGRWRWLPIGFLFAAVLSLTSWGVIARLPRLAVRFGAREIPGRAAAWLTVGFLIIAGASWGVTSALTRASLAAGRAVWPVIAPYVPARLAALETPPEPAGEAEPKPPPPPPAPKRDLKTWVHPGVLFKPASVEMSPDGVDLVLFFHGNGEVVKEAFSETQMNALVHITNLGIGSLPYQRKFSAPGVFPALIRDIEHLGAEKLGLPGLKIRRVALASWSAGYGAILAILAHKPAFERVDSVLIMDGIHGGFAPGGGRKVPLGEIAPFVRFAKEAAESRKMMVITHSAINTDVFFSSTEAADAIIAELGLTRTASDAATSPPVLTYPQALAAFPIMGRKWLKAKSEARQGEFRLLGYTGTQKEDHIAHLAQMSVTVLPPLKERWKQTPNR